MRKITLDEVWSFKDACKRVQAQQSIGCNGLCSAVSDALVSDLYGTGAYAFFDRLLSDDEYFGGLGPQGVFTKARRHFLDFLINMPDEDMLEILNQDC